MHPWSFRDHLVFSIGLAISRSRSLLRRILSEHAPDDARRELADRVVRHLEKSGFQLDEDGQALRKRPPLEPHTAKEEIHARRLHAVPDGRKLRYRHAALGNVV